MNVAGKLLNHMCIYTYIYIYDINLCIDILKYINKLNLSDVFHGFSTTSLKSSCFFGFFSGDHIVILGYDRSAIWMIEDAAAATDQWSFPRDFPPRSFMGIFMGCFNY